MSDLISRSELINALKVHFDSCFREDGELLYSDHICTSDDVVDLIKLVENQPTAYSIDKVVEELEKATQCIKIDGKPTSVKAIHPAQAIEIVKQVGVGTETETIRDKAVRWNNNSSKRVPYEFIDYVEGKREISVSDDVCGWKSASDGEFIQNPHTRRLYSNEPSMKNVYCNTCGKKIKIVGD